MAQVAVCSEINKKHINTVWTELTDGLGMWRVWVRRGRCIGFWWGKPKGRRPLGNLRRRCVDNIRMDLQEVGCGYMDRNGLAQDKES